MKRNLFVLMSLIVLGSMILAACGGSCPCHPGPGAGSHRAALGRHGGPGSDRGTCRNRSTCRGPKRHGHDHFCAGTGQPEPDVHHHVLLGLLASLLSEAGVGLR